MSKSAGTSLKDAVKQFETTKGCVAAEAEKVELWGRVPPIEKLDATLGSLKNCKHLALSSNNIGKISNLAGLDKLEILSLARNLLVGVAGLDAVAGTLQQLWLSYNGIIKLSGLECCTQLRVLYLANNLIKDYKELECVPSSVEELSLFGNPLFDASKAEGANPATVGSPYRVEILKRLPALKKIDGVIVDPDEREAARLGSAGRSAGSSTKAFVQGSAPSTAQGKSGGGLDDTLPPAEAVA